MEVSAMFLPGSTTTHIESGEKGFSKIDMLIKATGGLNLSQVCAVTGLEGTTIQNWVKRGWVANPFGKKYDEVHIARILIINALKECVKLEHISQLMNYVNGSPEYSNNPSVAGRGGIIKESELFNYLCDALERLGQVDDLPRGGVESVVVEVTKNYIESKPGALERIRRALTVMIYACVCTNVKRRTEAMIGQILNELGASNTEKRAASYSDGISRAEPASRAGEAEPRKTVSQALREWDLQSMESIIAEYESEGAVSGAPAGEGSGDDQGTKGKPGGADGVKTENASAADANASSGGGMDGKANAKGTENQSYRPIYFRKG